MPKKFRVNGVSYYASDGSVVPISKFERIQKVNGRVFGGQVAKDVRMMPSRWERAAIRKKYRDLMEVPEHQDLIRLNGRPEKTIDPRAIQWEDPFHSPLLVRVDSQT